MRAPHRFGRASQGGDTIRRTRRRPAAGFEPLEARALLSGTVTEVPAFPADHTDFGRNPAALVLRGTDLWFTARGANRIGRLDPGSLTPTFSPQTSDNPLGLAVAPDLSLWYTTQNGNKVGRFDPATGQLVEYAVPTPNSQPTGIARGPDGNMWFTEQTANKIGRITPQGQITEYDVPTPGSNPYAIAAGPDDNLWFTSFNTARIGRISTAGAITEYPLPTPGSGPLGIAPGPDGKVWFTEFAADKIGRIDPATGAIQEFALPRPAGTPADVVIAGPQGIVAGPDGAMYFTEAIGNRIGRIAPNGQMAAFAAPTPASRPVGVAVGGDGAVWFTQFDGDRIARLAYQPDPDQGLSPPTLTTVLVGEDRAIPDVVQHQRPYTARGTVTGRPNTAYTVRIFAGADAAPLGEAAVQTDASGAASFAALLVRADSGAVPADSTFTAVLLDPAGNTSARSAPAPAVQAATADLALSVVAAPTAGTLGATLTYTYQVRNNGPAYATGVIVAQAVPGGLTFLGGTANPGPVSLAGDSVRAALGTIAPGASATVSLTFRADRTGTFTHAPSAAADEPGDNPADNGAALTATIAAASLPGGGSPGGTPPGGTSSETPTPPAPRLVSVRWADPPRRKRGGTQLVLTFSAPVQAASAQDRARYRIVQAGRDRKLGTRDDRAVRFATASADATGQTVTLAFRARLARGTRYRLTVARGLAGANGPALDADAVVALVPGGTAQA